MSKEQKLKLVSSKGAHKRAVIADKLAKIVIYTGGIATIIAVVAILLFVFAEALPLWFGSESKESAQLNLKKVYQTKQALAIGLDEYKEILYTVTDSATVDFINLSDKKLISSIKIPGLEGQTVTSVSRSLSNHLLAVGTSAGNVSNFPD